MSEKCPYTGTFGFPLRDNTLLRGCANRLKPNPTLTARWAYTAEACREALTDAPSSIVAVRIRALKRHGLT